MTPIPETGFLVVADLTGPVVAAADLDAVEGGTRIRVRWQCQGAPRIDAAGIEGVRRAREAAFWRLARVVAGSLPVIEHTEVAS